MTAALRATRQYTDILASRPDGLLRSTRQYTDILASRLDGLLRSTRQYVDVLYVPNVGTEYELSVSQTLTLDHTIVGEINVEVVSQTLDLTQLITNQQDCSESISQTLNLTHTTFSPQDYSENVRQTLDLVQGSSAENMKRYFINQNLNLQSHIIASGPICKNVGSPLVLVQLIQSNVDYNCSIRHTLNLNSSFTYYSVNGSILIQYHPFVGSGTEHPPLTLVGPMAGIVARFQLVWPATGTVTDYVTLRAPEFGNKDTLTFNRINRETRGGTLIIFANPMWPKTQTLALTFTGLRQIEVQDLLSFLGDHLGLEIGLIDWETRYWKGVITTTTNPVTEDSFDNYTVNLEFQGELILDWVPQILSVPSGQPCRTRS